MILIIEAQGWCLFARIDHAEHARKIGLELRPTELILIGNPGNGTRLMPEWQLSAIDLPMKVLAWEDEHGQVRIAHNSMAWLKQRHGLTDEKTLQAIDDVLTKVCAIIVPENPRGAHIPLRVFVLVQPPAFNQAVYN